MSEERVTFDSKGGYKKGGELKDMDVKRDAVAETATSEVTSTQPAQDVVPPPPKAQGFSLSQLRETAASARIKEEPKVAAEEVNPEPVVEEAAPVATEEPEVKVEEQVSPVEGKVETTAPVEEPVVKAVAEETPPEPIPEKEEVTVTPKAEFSLSQMGLTPSEKAKEGETSEPADLNLEQPEPVGEKMDLTGNQTETVPVVEEKSAAAVEHFNIVPAAELLAIPYGADTLEKAGAEMKSWIVKVGKEFAKHPSSIFVSRNFPGLRAYALFYQGGRKGAACIGLGKGDDFTAVTYNAAKDTLVDVSRNLAISGMCVMSGNSPLAITTLIESNRTIEL